MIVKRYLALFLVLLVVELATARQPLIRWKLYKSSFNKTYSDVEDDYRREIWEENLALIERHNQLADEGKYSYWLKMNHFADLTKDEAYSTLYGLDMTVNVSDDVLKYQPLNVNLPEFVDWRTKNYVTEVKFQGECGACYAFATTGALEGQHARKFGKLVSLSEQNIIDCSQSYGNKGCHGGNMDKSFQYVIDNGGLDTEASYPYVARVEKCHFEKRLVGSSCTSYQDIPVGSETDLQEAVAKVGPVAVGIDAKHEEFRFYDHGIFDFPKCSSTKLNHGMLVVGYGTTDGKDYWLVKNSWGPRWGLAGYAKMSRNKDNQCGIATMASYPIL